MKGLTWSVEHHEDRPLLSLQQLPEVLEESGREREREGKMITKLYYNKRYVQHIKQLKV